MRIGKPLAALHQAIKRYSSVIWRYATHNLGLKLLSLLFALFFWSYVITSTPNIRRDKTLSAVHISLSGQARLNDRGLAVLTDVSNIRDVRLKVNVAQSMLSSVTSENVRGELDLLTINSEGKHLVRVRGFSAYGTVMQVSPEFIELDIDRWDVQDVPVNVDIMGGDAEAYRYLAVATPVHVMVTGPSTLVDMVSEARVTADVTGRDRSFQSLMRYALVDAQGVEVGALLERSPGRVYVAVEVSAVRGGEVG